MCSAGETIPSEGLRAGAGSVRTACVLLERRAAFLRCPDRRGAGLRGPVTRAQTARRCWRGAALCVAHGSARAAVLTRTLAATWGPASGLGPLWSRAGHSSEPRAHSHRASEGPRLPRPSVGATFASGTILLTCQNSCQNSYLGEPFCESHTSRGSVTTTLPRPQVWRRPGGGCAGWTPPKPLRCGTV